VSLTRMVQVSTLGTHLLSVPQEVVGKVRQTTPGNLEVEQA